MLLTGSLVLLLATLGHCDASDAMEMKRDLAHLQDRIAVEQRRGDMDEVVDLRQEQREKRDELAQWMKICGARVVGLEDSGRPLK